MNEKMSARKNGIGNVLVLGDNLLSAEELDSISDMIDEAATDERRYGPPSALSLAADVHNVFDWEVQ